MAQLLPTPAKLGLPTHFKDWRPGQDQVISDLLDSDKRFTGLVLPTGSGKSLSYLTYAKLHGGRVCILTSTKSLQSQLLHDFASTGLVDIRGMGNYRCNAEDAMEVMVHEAACHAGYKCPLKSVGCSYFDQLKVAALSKLVVTNYSFHFAHMYDDTEERRGGQQGVGKFDLLILDEAHAAPDELGDWLSVQVSQRQAGELGMTLPTSPGFGQQWAGEALRAARRKLGGMATGQSVSAGREARRLKDLIRKLVLVTDVHTDPDDWVVECGRRVVRFDIANPAAFAEEYLFRGIERVVLSSATIREKTLSLLGVTKLEYDMIEQKKGFPVQRRPVYFIPSAPITVRSTDKQRRVWLSRIDEVAGSRLDTRGIIATVSYERAREIYYSSAHAEHMILHDPGSQALGEAVKEYLRRDPPVILVSPAVTTGLDFPGDACRWIIIAKVPFPDQRSAIMKARSKADPDYPYYLAMQTVVQTSGRGMRSEDDYMECFIVDDSWKWFGRKFSHFAPQWFRSALRSTGKIPPRLKIA